MTKNAVRAVLPSTIAFVERVVPYEKTSVSASSVSTGSPSSPATGSSAARMPANARSRVVGALPIRSAPSAAATTTSVKVPPVSTEIRNAMGRAL